MAYNTEKYKKIFENRHGKGSFDKGLSSAREIGKLKVQGEFAKAQYISAIKKAQKEAEKRAEEETLYGGVDEKTYKARLGAQEKISNQQQKAQNQGRGGWKPDAKQVKKEREIQDYYDANKMFPEKIQKMVDNLDFGDADKINAEYNAKLKKEKEKKKEKGLLERLGSALKDTGKDIWEGAEDAFQINVLKQDRKKVLENTVKEYAKKKQKPSKITEEIARGSTRFMNSATLGAIKEGAKEADNKSMQSFFDKREGKGNAADIAYDIAGYLTPGLGAYKAVRGVGLGVKAGSKGLQKAGQLAKEGAIAGGALSVGEVGVREGINPEDYNWKDNAKLIGLGTAAGAIADPALYGAGKAISSGLSRTLKGNVPEFTGRPSESTLNRLTPRSSSPGTNFQSNELFDRLSRNGIARAPETPIAPSISERLAPLQNADQVAASRAPLEYENISSGGADPGLRRVNPTLADETVQTTGNADSFRSKIDRNSAKKENNFSSTLRTQFIDDVAPLENLEKQITGKVASAENSLYKQARLYKGSPEKAHLIVQEQLTPIINEVQKSGNNIQDLGDYALAVHAKDVNSKGINSGFTNAEIDDVINRLGSESMEAARKNLVKVNDDVLRMLSTGDSPVLNPSDVDAMRAKWPNYMSLFRSFDDDKIEFASGLSKALSVGSSPIKKLEGSSRNVIDPIESVVKNIFKATSVADRNKVASQLSKLAEVDTDGLVRKLPDGEDAGRMNVISAMENGKRVKYEVPPDVYKAMTNLDKESSNTLIKILQKPASTLRAGATLTPEFSLRNPLRDVPNAFVVSNSGFNPVIDFPVGLWQSIWKGRTIKIGGKEFKTSGDLYKQFIKENGGYGNIVSMDRELHQQTLKKALTDASTQYVDVLNPQVYKSLMKKFANPLNALRNVADVSETATKVGEFRAALRSGTSPQEAGYRARDIMDFARAGVSVREANKVVAFLNANMQGKSKLWRAFKENPAKVGGKAIASVTIPTIGAIVAQNTYANERQKEILNDAPQWLKDTFYLVPIPGTNQIARIPKPFDLAFMFSNPLERAFDFVAKNDKEAFDGFMKQAFSAMAVPTMLTGVAPIVEGMANYSFFRQGPIIPQREENINFPDQYDINTTETAKFVGSQINKVTGGTGAFRNFGSPRVIDNTIQGFTGGLGTYATSSIDWFLDETNAIDKPEKPAKGIDQKPLAKAFLVNQNTSGKSLEKLYNLKDKLADARGSAKQNGKPFEDEQKYNVANRLTKGLAGLNKQIRTVENSPELSGEEKKTQLEMLIRQRNEAARKAMETLNNME